MATPTKITITVEEKRSRNFQTVGESLTVELQLEPNEDPEAVREEWEAYLRQQVRVSVCEHLAEIGSDI